MIGGWRITSDLSIEVKDEMKPCRRKFFECDVNEFLIKNETANGIKLGDEEINLLKVLVCIIALHFNNRKSLDGNKTTVSILKLKTEL